MNTILQFLADHPVLIVIALTVAAGCFALKAMPGLWRNFIDHGKTPQS